MKRLLIVKCNMISDNVTIKITKGQIWSMHILLFEEKYYNFREIHSIKYLTTIFILNICIHYFNWEDALEKFHIF